MLTDMVGCIKELLLEGKNVKIADLAIFSLGIKNNDGSVQTGRPLDMIGAHCANHNRHSIGICYVGGLATDGKTPKDTRTEAQKTALRRLLERLRKDFPKALIVGHRDLNPMKSCPCFDAVREYRDL